jgi:hypothetical protein
MLSLSVFAEVAQYDPKMRSYEDNIKIHSAFQRQRSAMLCTLSKNGKLENLKYLGEFEQDFQNYWIYP